MTGWQWFGACLLFLVCVGILTWFMSEFKTFMKLVWIFVTLTIVVLGVFCLLLGTWVPW